MRQAIVTTSIHGLTEEIEAFAELDGWDVIYVADRKTPDFSVDRDDFIHLTVERQQTLDQEYAQRCPWNRFQRKNIGYAYAVQEGYDRIADVDDDNMPYDNWAEWLDNDNKAKYVIGPKYPNLYTLSTSADVWPRGFPLSELHDRATKIAVSNRELDSEPAVIQGFVDGDPDVDAINRLVVNKTDVTFKDKGPFVVEEGRWSQFNAQNTLWQKCFPLMYLPTTTTMRVTDILRSYVAQRVMWEHDERLSFSRATVYQDRNDHDLMVDFQDELANYLDVKQWVDSLERVELSGDNVSEDLYDCYRQLVKDGYIDHSEMNYVQAWVNSL